MSYITIVGEYVNALFMKMVNPFPTISNFLNQQWGFENKLIKKIKILF